MKSHYIELLDTRPGWRFYISMLEKKRQFVIRQRDAEVMLKDIARDLGVTKVRARQLEISAYNELKVLRQWGGKVFPGSRPLGRPKGSGSLNPGPGVPRNEA